MFSEKITRQEEREREEIDKRLEAIEKVQSENIRELFVASGLSSEDFTGGILDFSQEDQQGIVSAMLEDEMLALILGHKLKGWREAPPQSRRAILETAYDILDFSSKVLSSPMNHGIDGLSRMKSAVVSLIEEPEPAQKKTLVYYQVAVVVGDRHGRVGIGFGESKQGRRHCIDKAVKIARNQVVRVPLVGGTLAREVSARDEETEVYMRPADPGTGIVSEDCLPIVFHQAGIRDLRTEIKGNYSRKNLLKATMNGFRELVENGPVNAHRI